MNGTRGTAPPSTTAPPPSAKKRRGFPRILSGQEVAQRKARALATSRRRAASLLEDGYRFRIADQMPGQLGVVKPGADVPSYTVTLRYSEDDQRWEYHCDCPFFLGQAAGGCLCPECKHGERAVKEAEAARRLYLHLTRGGGDTGVCPRGSRFATAPASNMTRRPAAPPAPETPEPPAEPQSPAENVWPTKRGFRTNEEYQQARSLDFD